MAIDCVPFSDRWTERNVKRDCSKLLKGIYQCGVDEPANLLPTATFAHNNSYNHSQKMTPFKCVFDPELRIDVADGVPTGEIPSAKNGCSGYVRELRKQASLTC